MTRPRALLLGCGIALLLLAAGARADSLDGFWLSDGYGYLAEIRGNRLELYEVTPFSCIASRRLTAEASANDPRGDEFVSKDRSSVLFLTPGPAADSEWFHDPEAASKILFRRAAQRPEACGKKTPNDPRTNFEIFAWTFGAHHGFLEYRGVDWAAVTEDYRPNVKPGTTPDELFRIFRSMIEPLHDEHTFLEAPDLKRQFNGKRPGTLILTDAEKKRTVEILQARYLDGRLRSFCRDHVRYGRLKAGFGYLRIDSFYDYAAKGGFDPAARALDEALDEALRDARDLPGLVLDVRINGGGDDPLGLLIAGRLTAKPYVAYVKRARNNPLDPEKWTDPQPATVQPSTRASFGGKIVELIGSDTVSAGETFTMALMGREPHVTRIGENTQGVYSDVLGRSLPNGWRFGMPNEVFLTESGTHFEATGVQPDVRVPVFPKEDLELGRDGALEKAVEILSGAAPPNPD